MHYLALPLGALWGPGGHVGIAAAACGTALLTVFLHQTYPVSKTLRTTFICQIVAHYANLF